MNDPSAQVAQVAQRLPAARAGSPQALGEVLEACRGYLTLIAQQELASGLRAKGGASDLVQETLMEAVRDFARFTGDSEAELLLWLRRLLLNNLADFTRQYRATEKRQLDREVALATGDPSSHGAIALTAAMATPSAELVALEQSANVCRVLERLPEDYRQVVYLRYQEGQSFDQIGQALGLTANAARKLLMRAIERVQLELGESR